MSTSQESEGFLVADENRIQKVLRRLSHRVYGAFDEAPVIIGIRRRGVPLAERLAAHLRENHRWTPTVGEVTLKRYTDDLTLLHDRPKLTEDSLTACVDGAGVLLVDDVLYTGRTLLRAAEFLLAAGADCAHSAVLCSRDQPEVPVAANFVGLRLDVGTANVVEVNLPPYEDRSAIILRHRDEVE
mgnify:CR=1 FL=1